MRNSFSLAALFITSLFTTAAYTQTFAPGEYIAEGGWGYLKIDPAAGNRQKFSLESAGANGHMCTLEGEIVDRVARVPTDDKNYGPLCVVNFAAKGTGIDLVSVKNDDNACHAFCGARAGFDGTYLKPAPGCTTPEVKRTRAVFKQAYDRKDYARARGLLEPLLKACQSALSDLQAANIRNDLAVTLHHLNDHAACRHVLEPLRDLARMDKDELAATFPPLDAEVRVSVARAARTNLRLCKSKL